VPAGAPDPFPRAIAQLQEGPVLSIGRGLLPPGRGEAEDQGPGPGHQAVGPPGLQSPGPAAAAGRDALQGRPRQGEHRRRQPALAAQGAPPGDHGGGGHPRRRRLRRRRRLDGPPRPRPGRAPGPPGRGRRGPGRRGDGGHRPPRLRALTVVGRARPAPRHRRRHRRPSQWALPRDVVVVSRDGHQLPACTTHSAMPRRATASSRSSSRPGSSRRTSCNARPTTRRCGNRLGVSSRIGPTVLT
jgi:hypothetical protein